MLTFITVDALCKLVASLGSNLAPADAQAWLETKQKFTIQSQESQDEIDVSDMDKSRADALLRSYEVDLSHTAGNELSLRFASQDAEREGGRVDVGIQNGVPRVYLSNVPADSETDPVYEVTADLTKTGALFSAMLPHGNNGRFEDIPHDNDLSPALQLVLDASFKYKDGHFVGITADQ